MMTINPAYVTQLVTQKIIMSVNTSFKIRKDLTLKNGSTPIYLDVTGNGGRKMINLELHVDPKYWIADTQSAKPIDQAHRDLNLVLDHVRSRISDIKIKYRLNNTNLTPGILKEELIQGNHRVNFVSYMKFKINEDKRLSKGTIKRYTAVANNLDRYKPEILFTDITAKFITKYRNNMIGEGKKITTVNSNIIAIKRYLKLAKKDGIHIQLDLEDVQGGITTGNRVSLNPAELRTLTKYYFDRKIDPKKQLTLGYFLFSCMTGLRISDVMQLNRNQLIYKDIAFKNIKTTKDQTVALNKMAKKIVDFNPNLFLVKHTDQDMNRDLKRIIKNNRIQKKVSFHVARHTFATNFLRMGGQLQHLQKLLNHSKIETTMIYVHILADEANAEIHKLDDMFKDYGFNLEIEY
ncbi:tyrosine-type recombinase/integrase [Flavobacterium hauense]